jgi:hypothetical protein
MEMDTLQMTIQGLKESCAIAHDEILVGLISFSRRIGLYW